MEKINLIREVRELKTHLSYSKNIGFFFGAGTSCALKIPNVEQLTKGIEAELKDENKANFIAIKEDLKTIITDRNVNIEDILNHIRRIREITGEVKTKSYQGVTGDSAKTLDVEICKIIYQIIAAKESVADISQTKKFFAWLSMLNRDFSKEIFTTNYDLIIEKSLEASQIPYFDGFVGSYEPFFWQESIDQFVSRNDLTQNWIRLWKIHGSLSWFWKIDPATKAQKIIRQGKIEKIEDEKNELVIYPSKEKYDSSKKQPFIAYFDRLKNYLLSGELLFIFSGYSFSDQHINEIIFNCLRQNNRLTALVFFFQDAEVENLHKLTSSYMNLIVFGPTKAIVNGNLGEWQYSADDLKPNEKSETYWNSETNKFKLSDFNELVNFLVSNSGKREAIENITK
ncbi:SIR2 family protein [Cloacibacterium normanense]|uniref:SIR2-like domain protein n=1 Tax=Cloacibacterium normanense TaxID=237258 RepID=A0A1E5UDU5_9FLAO|nr:SIR2 family protein [Cloacibacterium normanense]AZI69766.1 SIR2 family protein [Cloacibacterium normanense]OEL11091.1 SIR2-like domain protein [Cloacibacterium normanense]SDO87646.1 SIR2-like domain-containing protein [Cloacibacterium normanense]